MTILTIWIKNAWELKRPQTVKLHDECYFVGQFHKDVTFQCITSHLSSKKPQNILQATFSGSLFKKWIGQLQNTWLHLPVYCTIHGSQERNLRHQINAVKWLATTNDSNVHIWSDIESIVMGIHIKVRKGRKKCILNYQTSGTTTDQEYHSKLPESTKQHFHYKLHCLWTNLPVDPIHSVFFHKLKSYTQPSERSMMKSEFLANCHCKWSTVIINMTKSLLFNV